MIRKAFRGNLNIANALTISRLVAVPIYLYILFGLGDGYRLLAIVVLALAALTDFFDGYLARKLGCVSEFGKMADPFVDRVLIISVLIALYIKVSGALPLWAVGAVVGRDALMLVGSAAILRSGKRFSVTFAGKLSTAILLTALCLLTLNGLGPVFNIAGLAAFYIGLALSLVTGLIYVGSGTKLLLSKQGAGEIPAQP